jgi:plasmid stabilization system protein ParE
MANAYFPIVTNFAEEDLIEILDYFVDKNPDFISKLVKRIDTRLEELRQYPQKGRIVPELEKKSITDYRELIEGNYRIIYHIKERNVYVLSIIDGRRNFEEIIVTKLMRI